MSKKNDDASSFTMGDMIRDQQKIKENWVVDDEQWVENEADAKKIRDKLLGPAKRAGKLVDYVPASGRQGGFMVRVHVDKNKRK
jgi:hypothetical protein